MGHTGAGKTSLVSLLARYYEFQGGSIEIDGIDIRDMSLNSYRSVLGNVLQEVFLFSGTIEENIRYGRQEASEEDLWNAINTVHLEELIEYLPEGLQTQIGERGKGLSAGQQQLEVLLSNRTSIIIAHRLSTIVSADRIIVMDNGQIVEEGTHNSLLTQGGKYAKLYKQFFEHQSLDWEPNHGSLKIE